MKKICIAKRKYKGNNKIQYTENRNTIDPSKIHRETFEPPDKNKLTEMKNVYQSR